MDVYKAFEIKFIKMKFTKYQMRTGQISIFILLGLLIMLVVGFFVFYAVVQLPLLGKEAPIVASVRTLVSYCLETQLNDAISFIALHGGYFEKPAFVVEGFFNQDNFTGIPYYFLDDNEIAPSEEDVEQQLALSLYSKIDACTNISGTPYKLSFSSEKSYVTTFFTQTTVEATVTFPLQIQTEDSVYTIDTFSLSVPSNLFKLYSAARSITKEQSSHPDVLCITCLSELATAEELYLGMVEIQKYPYYSILYVLNDRDTTHETVQHLSFYFGHGFLQVSSEQNISISPVEKQTALIGYKYEYQIAAKGNNLTFSDDSSVFDIDSETGIISFTPDSPDIGSWIVTITVTDENKNTAHTQFVFEVTDVVSSELSLEALPYFIAHVGKEFNYTVNVTASQSVYLLDDTDLFDINTKTGLIQFTPTTAQIGSHSFTIAVIDALGKSIEQTGFMVIAK